MKNIYSDPGYGKIKNDLEIELTRLKKKYAVPITDR
jgi:hypothetical protein